MTLVYKGREQGLGKEEMLFNLAQVEGLYVPRFYTPQYDADGNFAGMEHDSRVPAIVKRRWVRDLDKYPNTSAILTSETEFQNMFIAEVARGCGVIAVSAWPGTVSASRVQEL